MDFEELIQTRRSIRAYEETEVPLEIIREVVDAARWAPSAGNLQPWHFYVVRTREIREKLGECFEYPSKWFASAPVVIVVAALPEQSAVKYQERGRSLYCLQDTAAAVQNILLSAKAHHLGTCWMGAFREEQCIDVLQLEPSVRPVAIIPLGYPRREPDYLVPRAPLDEVMTLL